MEKLSRPRQPADDVVSSLGSFVDHWLDEGIISPEQARRMLTSPAPDGSAARPSTHASIAVEAAGYLGGSLLVVATILIGAQFWSELSMAVRIGTAGGAALALLAAGTLMSGHGGSAGDRMVAVLWLASIAAAVGLFVLVTDSPAIGRYSVPLTAAGAAAYAAALWAFRHFLTLQIAVFVGLMTATATAIAELTTRSSLPGLGLWGVAAAWLVLGWVGRLGPRLAVMTLGAAGLVLGAILTLPSSEGFVLAFGTVASVASLGVALHAPPLLFVAAAGALQVLPALVMERFPESTLAPFILLAAGVLLVGASVWVARGRRAPRR